MARITFAPLMPAIEKDLGISHGGAGFFFLMISGGYFVTVLCSGFLSARLTHRLTIVISSTTAGMVLMAVSVGAGVASMTAGLFVLGMAAGLYLPSGIATITTIVTHGSWGKALAIHEIAPNLSFVAAPLISEALMRFIPWRGVIASMGIVSILAGLGYWRFGKGGRFHGQAPNIDAITALIVKRDFWLMVILFGMGIAGTLGVYTMLPLYLVSGHGMERDLANTLIALSRIAGMAMAFVAGWATDRFGPRRTLIWVFIATGLATISLGISSRGIVGFLVFLQPLVAVCFFPAGFAAVASIGTNNARNVAVSLTVPAAFVMGGGLVPTGVGLLGDAGYFALGVSLVGLMILSGSFIALFLDLDSEKMRP
ncbi:MAG: MFS transporter [Desulfobacteraceae bacterium]|nr:MAG: MFS transporter [Desulfobacteraceae bacterium]